MGCWLRGQVKTRQFVLARKMWVGKLNNKCSAHPQRLIKGGAEEDILDNDNISELI